MWNKSRGCTGVTDQASPWRSVVSHLGAVEEEEETRVAGTGVVGGGGGSSWSLVLAPGGRAVSAALELPEAYAEAEAQKAARGWKDPAVRVSVTAAQALPRADAEAVAQVAEKGWNDPAVRDCLVAGAVVLGICQEADVSVSAGQALPKAGLLELASTVAAALSWW